MSSATSIERAGAEQAPPVDATPDAAAVGRDPFRPWHFFVLASLIAATAAVVVAREARPEHLVLVSLTIGAAGFAAATFYRTLYPLVSKDPPAPTDRLTESMRAVLEREKTLVLRSIKELEFDRAMGKVSTRDFDEMAGRLRARAMSLMRQLDADGSGYRELIERELSARLNSPRAAAAASAAARPAERKIGNAGGAVSPSSSGDEPDAAVACSCGTLNDIDAAFCKRCGLKLDQQAGA